MKDIGKSHVIYSWKTRPSAYFLESIVKCSGNHIVMSHIAAYIADLGPERCAKRFGVHFLYHNLHVWAELY